jgi:hypothetical protein
MLFVTNKNRDKRVKQPFRTNQVAESPYFADRDKETRRVLGAMRNRERLVLYGERRQGKSSIIARAARRLRKEGGVVILIDAWKIRNLDGINRAILRAVPSSWIQGPRLERLMRAFGGLVGVTPDEEGRPVLRLVGMGANRDAHPDESLERILGGLNHLAGQHEKPVVVVIDEFQTLEKIRPEGGAFLRGVVQVTGNLGWIFAGSVVGLVTELIGPTGPFHGIERLEVGEIPPDFLARWLEERSTGHGVGWAPGAGAYLVSRSGPVTEYIVRLAKTVHGIAGQVDETVGEAMIDRAFSEIVGDMDGTFDLVWSKTSDARRRVLRGVAAGEVRLTTDHFLSTYGLRSSSASSRAEGELREEGILAPGKPPRISDPFLAEWIRATA